MYIYCFYSNSQLEILGFSIDHHHLD